MIRGAAVVDANVAYFVSLYGQTCSFHLSYKKWSDLPICPHHCVSLVIVRGLLTAIGGTEGYTTIGNKLLSIVSDGDKKWVEHFPPMPTKRSHTAAVTTKQHLIVAGGESQTNLSIVEVMDIEILVLVNSS